MAKYSTSRKALKAAAAKVAPVVAPKKVVAPKAKEIEVTIEDILEDAKDGVLKDKSIKAVKKLAKK